LPRVCQHDRQRSDRADDERANEDAQHTDGPLPDQVIGSSDCVSDGCGAQSASLEKIPRVTPQRKACATAAPANPPTAAWPVNALWKIRAKATESR
jgi:hypothetical protein